MHWLALPSPVVADGSDVLRGAAVGIVTLVLLVTALVVVGFVVLFRRRGDSGIRVTGGNSLDALSKRAASLLIQLDDGVRDADEELGYAIAQFGADKARSYSDALTGARAKLAEAFRIKQSLDDAFPDSEQQQREWTLQVIALCEQAQSALAAQDSAFGDLRKLEVNAAGTLADVRSRIAATTERIAASRKTLTTLAKNFAPTTFAQVTGNVDQAQKALVDATASADAAAPGISAAGVSAVSTTLQQAGQQAHRADQLLDAVDRTARDLQSATEALETLRTTTRADLVEAATERDKAPDADTGQAIIDAMKEVDTALDAPAGPADPVAELDRIGEAVSDLDLALASARNQTERLAHAKAAYEGTLVSVRTQIADARAYIGSHGSGVDARTRLAEAERQLTIAEAETDPVEALDAVRRAVTHARDADALARYDSMGGH